MGWTFSIFKFLSTWGQRQGGCARAGGGVGFLYGPEGGEGLAKEEEEEGGRVMPGPGRMFAERGG